MVDITNMNRATVRQKFFRDAPSHRHVQPTEYLKQTPRVAGRGCLPAPRVRYLTEFPEPVTAQVMMTLRFIRSFSFLNWSIAESV